MDQSRDANKALTEVIDRDIYELSVLLVGKDNKNAEAYAGVEGCE
jgi:hypothetical protein